jgi:hypothetical protein
MTTTTPPTARPRRASDLSETERSFVREMHDLHFGRFESLVVSRGELCSRPDAKKVQQIKFGASRDIPSLLSDFELKAQIIEFFVLVRSLEEGVIRSLEIRYGLPASIDIEQALGQGMTSKKFS